LRCALNSKSESETGFVWRQNTAQCSRILRKIGLDKKVFFHLQPEPDLQNKAHKKAEKNSDPKQVLDLKFPEETLSEILYDYLLKRQKSAVVNVYDPQLKWHIWDFKYPSDQDLMRTGLRGIYLANYLPWDSRRYSKVMIKKYQALSAKNSRTFDTYDRIDDRTYMTIHDILKSFQYGYSRVTDNLCREIRFKRINRKDALAVERHCQAEYPQPAICAFLKWLGMERAAFDWYAKTMHDFKKVPRNSNLDQNQQTFSFGFVANGPSVNDKNKSIIYGKGLKI
jgi:hypothetical protein